MVKAIVEIDERANQILNIIKAKENLKDKSAAINLIVEIYGQELLEPELRPEFIKELLNAQKEKTIKVSDFSSHYNK
jgi:NADH:ubiquinone oxidoreductase subunit E